MPTRERVDAVRGDPRLRDLASRVWLGWLVSGAGRGGDRLALAEPPRLRTGGKPRSWAAKGIYGEKLWLKERDRVPPDQLRVLRMLVPIGAAGFVLLTFGVVTLEVWPTVFGASLIVLAQLWRIDRLVVFYESTQ